MTKNKELKGKKEVSKKIEKTKYFNVSFWNDVFHDKKYLAWVTYKFTENKIKEFTLQNISLNKKAID